MSAALAPLPVASPPVPALPTTGRPASGLSFCLV